MAAISSLAQNPDDHATDKLLSLVQSGGDAQTRQAALSALGQIGTPRARDALIEPRAAARPKRASPRSPASPSSTIRARASSSPI